MDRLRMRAVENRGANFKMLHDIICNFIRHTVEKEK